MKSFYEKYFQANAGELYANPAKEFSSYFLEFVEGGRLEIMTNPKIINPIKSEDEQIAGFTHLAISVGSKEAVDQLTGQLRNDGFEIVGEPRTTGDGYYESVVLDPEYNRIEITI
jgi:lactoylglutathione lyase